MNGRRIWAVMTESFWILLLALVALFVFLLALGAYSPGEVVTLTIVMVVLFLLWLGHAIWVSRRADGARPARDRRARAARLLGVSRQRRRTSTAALRGMGSEPPGDHRGTASSPVATTKFRLVRAGRLDPLSVTEAVRLDRRASPNPSLPSRR